MAISKAPRCEIRCLVMHIYPDGIKAYGHERITQPIGRRGKPIKKLRYMPMARAQALARKLQSRPSATVSVICGQGLGRPGSPGRPSLMTLPKEATDSKKALLLRAPSI
jgi:hypothetical protein